MARVLVTGGEGFIGSHLIERLVENGHEVKSTCCYTFNSSLGWISSLPSNIQSELEIKTGDIRDPGFVNSITEKIDIVFHLAALIGIPYSYVAPYSYVDTNVKGTLNILEAVKKNEVQRLLVTSTSEVYGSAQSKPIYESHPLVGQSPYSASKIAADALATSYRLSFDTPVSIIRPFNTFGPRQSLRAVIPSLILQFIDKNIKSIKVGNLNTTRDFNYVQDTVDGFISASVCNNLDLGPYNLSTGKEVSISSVLSLLKDITKTDADVVVEQDRVRPESSEVSALVGSSDRAYKSFSWKSKVEFSEGLEKTVDWFKKNKNIYENYERYHT